MTAGLANLSVPGRGEYGSGTSPSARPVLPRPQLLNMNEPKGPRNPKQRRPKTKASDTRAAASTGLALPHPPGLCCRGHYCLTRPPKAKTSQTQAAAIRVWHFLIRQACVAAATSLSTPKAKTSQTQAAAIEGHRLCSSDQSRSIRACLVPTSPSATRVFGMDGSRILGEKQLALDDSVLSLLIARSHARRLDTCSSTLLLAARSGCTPSLRFDGRAYPTSASPARRELQSLPASRKGHP
ncbi:hypothetical protein K491DRAFT_685165 [Lophiostoma macrostomum CBS 122681]|uniref:Uncharacterized protein n=1 Tax=Lophiostoma macrostomum CBS 122681 TaxID=1314788 RepID=A0A6A6SND1_9PLEO|nr:hypothetical protein K491DRAFT_685165 [Lophiostoma macrostomum CBS 122681]